LTRLSNVSITPENFVAVAAGMSILSVPMKGTITSLSRGALSITRAVIDS